MNTKNWKDKELNRLLMERFGYSMSEGGCKQVHPGMTHEQYLEENELEEGSCYNGKRDGELEEDKDQDGDGDSDFADVQMARMKASGMSEEEAMKNTRKHNK